MKGTMKTYTLEEQAENRRKWVEELRKGDFQQCQKAITKDGKFCCLGVGAMLLDCTPVLPYDKPAYDAAEKGLGIRHLSDFISMNDSEGMSFPQIADAIESRPGLFVQGEGK